VAAERLVAATRRCLPKDKDVKWQDAQLLEISSETIGKRNRALLAILLGCGLRGMDRSLEPSSRSISRSVDSESRRNQLQNVPEASTLKAIDDARRLGWLKASPKTARRFVKKATAQIRKDMEGKVLVLLLCRPIALCISAQHNLHADL
jgi:hypothetical protein